MLRIFINSGKNVNTRIKNLKEQLIRRKLQQPIFKMGSGQDF